MSANNELTLTERRHRQTRRAIADAAVSLFVEQGYDDVTMDQVAEAAGVSRRTAYRHFPNKYDLVFDHPTRWLEVFDTTIASREPAEATRDVIRRGVVAVAAEIERTSAEVLDAWNVFVSTETLMGRNARAQQQWRETYALMIAADLAEPADLLEVTTLAGALVAMTDALCFTWASNQPSADMVELTTRALEIIDPLWPDACR